MDDEYLKNISTKIDKISEDITDIKVTSARHDENLKDHMKRSDLLEHGQEIIFQELIPIKAHVSQVQGVVKFLGLLGAITTFVLGTLRLLGKL